MSVGLNNSYLLALFSGGSSSSFDYSALATPLTGVAAGAKSTAAAKPVAPTAPWTNGATAKVTSAEVTKALAGANVVDESAAQLDLPGASADYRKLFGLYQGLSTLSQIVTNASAKGVSPTDLTRYQKTFASGLSQIQTYIANNDFDNLRLADGAVASTASAKLAVPKTATSYTTAPLANSATDEVPAFQGNVQFNISIKRINQTVDVPIDLSQMGSQPRTIGNVINFINSQLAASGMATRFASVREPGQPRTLTSGGQTITLPASSDQWAMKVNVGTAEAVTFSAPQTANAVYLTQASGDPNPDKDPTTNDSDVRQQLLKFQTDDSAVPAPLQGTGQANWVDGRVFADTLGKEVGTIHATQTAPDGSVYMLADVTAATDGQSIRGTQDVALLKYDPAGQLIYSRTLGSADTATGLGLAVSSGGKVAVTGSITGSLDGSTNGALNSTGAFSDDTDSFVTLYDASGQEMWTERRGARQNDEASQVAFSADGATVYVAGRTQSMLPGTNTAVQGGYDGYIEAFTTDSKGLPHAQFTQTFGTAQSDKPAGMVVNGNSLMVASLEAGHAVLRNFDISSGTPVQQSVRDLGDLQGGSIAGLAMDGNNVVVAGTTTNGALGGAAPTTSASGGSDGFVMEMSANLADTSADSLNYYGGSGDDKVTAMAVSNGEVWLAGQAGTDLTGAGGADMPAMGKKDSFLTGMDLATGAVDWARRFTGKDGMSTPNSIAVAAGGASVLDRLGLPSGTLHLADSQRLTAQSSLRPGDQFTVQAGDGVAKTVTIDPGETLDTLAQKIQRASGFEATVTLPVVGGVKSLRIAPANARMTVVIGNGPGDKNALPILGLTPGVLRSTTTTTDSTGATTTVPADGKSQLYGLGLDSTLNLSSAADISHAASQIAQAMGVIRKAYQDLVAAATPASVKAAQAQAAKINSGTVPAYLTAQIANYQAGLARLTGGS